MTMNVFGYALRPGERAAHPTYGVEDLAIETEDQIAGIGPEGAIGRHVERVNLGGARQPFGRPHQAKTGSIIAVQAPFGPGPDIAGMILGQGQDDHILEPFGRPIVPETVLLCEPSDAKRQHQHPAPSEARLPDHQTLLFLLSAFLSRLSLRFVSGRPAQPARYQ